MIASGEVLLGDNSLGYFKSCDDNANFGIPGQLLRDVILPVTRTNTEMWQALIREFGDRQDPPQRTHSRNKEQSSPLLEDIAPLPKLPPGPWRSLGGHFDYSTWQDRNRFLELDRALARAQSRRPESADDGDDFLPTAA